jgi:hypothetical protein
MSSLNGKPGYLGVVALLLFAPAALPATANINITSLGSNVLDGTHVGAYTATINGVSTQVVYDDWADITSVGRQWTANVNTLSPLTHGKTQTIYANNQLLYDQVAWLTTQILAPPTHCAVGKSCDIVGDISYALWELTGCSLKANPTSCEHNPKLAGTAFANLSGNDLANAQWWLADVPKSFASGSFSNFDIYSSTSAWHGTPQEVIADPLISPESSAMVLFGADLCALLALVIVFRRRLRLIS